MSLEIRPKSFRSFEKGVAGKCVRVALVAFEKLMKRLIFWAETHPRYVDSSSENSTNDLGTLTIIWNRDRVEMPVRK